VTAASPNPELVYDQIIEYVFNQHWSEGSESVEFARPELIEAAIALGLPQPANLGDVIYAYRFRRKFPASIRERAPEHKHWILRLAGKAKYRFDTVTASARVVPRTGLVVTKIPDATPELVRSTALNDEQALLALVRYNRLVDIFLNVAAYSLQNHLRTTVPSMGQVEVDEVYVAVDRFGVQYAIPVQAKGGSDEIGVAQAEQDLAVCAAKWPSLRARPVAAQFMTGGVIALFELAVQDEEIVVLREAHYKLVNADQISDADRELYAVQQSSAPDF
jgi:hypothetical protein